MRRICLISLLLGAGFTAVLLGLAILVAAPPILTSIAFVQLPTATSSRTPADCEEACEARPVQEDPPEPEPEPEAPKVLFDCSELKLAVNDEGDAVGELPEEPTDLDTWGIQIWHYSVQNCLGKMEFYPPPPPLDMCFPGQAVPIPHPRSL